MSARKCIVFYIMFVKLGCYLYVGAMCNNLFGTYYMFYIYIGK